MKIIAELQKASEYVKNNPNGEPPPAADPPHGQKSSGGLPASPSCSPNQRCENYSTGGTAAQKLSMPSKPQPNGAAHASNGSPTEVTHLVELRRLAALTPMAYDQERVEASDRLGVRVTTLDTEVSKLRGGPAVTAGQGRAIEHNDPEPWFEPVDGTELLSELTEIHRRHIILPSGAAEVLAFWAVLTYCFDAFVYTPIVLITAPEKGCGKTRVRDVDVKLVYRCLSAENASTSALFRLIERDKPTVFLDEFDNADLETRRDLLAILNSGFQRTGAVARVVGEDHEPRQFSTYCPKMLVGIGNNLPDSTTSRCIVIPLRRKLPSEKVDHPRDFDGTEVRQRIRRWVDDNRSLMAGARPLFPDWMDDRQRDIMEPLLVIADLAGGGWGERLREALRHLVDGRVDPTEKGTMLLSDIRGILGGEDRITTAALLERLNRLEERPWPTYNRVGGFNAKNLAAMLKVYGVESRSTKMPDGSSPKGFHRDQLEDAFERYLPPSTPPPPVLQVNSRHPATKAVAIGQNPLLAPATGPLDGGSENPTSPNVCGAGCGVAGEIQEPQPKGVHDGVQPPPSRLDEVDDWEGPGNLRDTQNDPGK